MILTCNCQTISKTRYLVILDICGYAFWDILSLTAHISFLGKKLNQQPIIYIRILRNLKQDIDSKNGLSWGYDQTEIKHICDNLFNVRATYVHIWFATRIQEVDAKIQCYANSARFKNYVWLSKTWLVVIFQKLHCLRQVLSCSWICQQALSTCYLAQRHKNQKFQQHKGEINGSLLLLLPNTLSFSVLLLSWQNTREYTFVKNLTMEDD